jgi:hypothetical protein
MESLSSNYILVWEVLALARSIEDREAEILWGIVRGKSPKEAHKKRRYDDWTTPRE